MTIPKGLSKKDQYYLAWGWEQVEGLKRILPITFSTMSEMSMAVPPTA